jgi:hypothetical protein
MKPSDYKHIAAWCRVNGIEPGVRRKILKIAIEDSAPIDAVYRTAAGWVTIANVGVRTRMAVEVELNRGRKS